ncbi:unnamed protein product [Mytilus coruscus]|uniref:Uncharacterized protein n=1 Tax=Mytilus coruscus TaxID=42192 RepID=A0A6J8F2A1_MYTCO|nr:unnamed protein product [Mytilus coruscus]
MAENPNPPERPVLAGPRKRTSSNDGNINKDTVTSGEQRPCQNQSEQDSGSSGAHRLVEDSNHEHFPTDSVRERENDDVVSLAPGHRERHDIGLLSEDESSLKSETENPQKSSSRFSKYVKGNESDSDENNNDHLKTLFGDDVKQKKRQALEGKGKLQAINFLMIGLRNLKFDNAQQGSTFTGAKSSTQRTVLRTNTVTRPDKDDKSSVQLTIFAF